MRHRGFKCSIRHLNAGFIDLKCGTADLNRGPRFKSGIGRSGKGEVQHTPASPYVAPRAVDIPVDAPAGWDGILCFSTVDVLRPCGCGALCTCAVEVPWRTARGHLLTPDKRRPRVPSFPGPPDFWALSSRGDYGRVEFPGLGLPPSGPPALVLGAILLEAGVQLRAACCVAVHDVRSGHEALRVR